MTETMNVNAAGQFPAGFKSGSFYKSRQHPVGLETTIFGVSDALGYSGIDWDTDIKPFVDPSRVGVFSGPASERLSASPVEKIIVTDTLPLSENMQLDKVEVLSVAPLIAEAIRAVFEDTSVSEIFGGNNLV